MEDQSIVDQLRSTGDYQITITIVTESGDKRSVLTSPWCADHFVSLIFYESTTYYGLEISKKEEGKWELIGWPDEYEPCGVFQDSCHHFLFFSQQPSVGVSPACQDLA